jgi:hypothetical protein
MMGILRNIFLLIGVLHFSLVFSSESSDVVVTVMPKYCVATGAELIFTLKNSGSKDIDVAVDDLPWTFRYSTHILAIDINGVLLKEVLPIVEPNPNKRIIIKSNTKIQGSIKLLERFPEIEKIRKKSGVIVFWTFVPRNSFDEVVGHQKPSGGWLPMIP